MTVYVGHYEPLKTDEKNQISGTHGGKLSADARAIRSAKNARNASRAGEATRPRGSHKKAHPSGHGKR